MVAVLMALLVRLYLDSPSKYLPEMNTETLVHIRKSTSNKFVTISFPFMIRKDDMVKHFIETSEKIKSSICRTASWRKVLPRKYAHCQGAVC